MRVNPLIHTCFRLERLDYLAQKFKSKCDNHEQWASGKDDMLRNKDYKNCRLNELKVSHCYEYVCLSVCLSVSQWVSGKDDMLRNKVYMNCRLTHTHTHTHDRFTALLESVRDHAGEQVPER